MTLRRRRSRVERARAAAEEHPNLSGGLAVVVAVTTLLELLRRAVDRRAHDEITGIWVAGRQLSQQVVGSHLLKDTVVQSRRLVAELEQHVHATEETTP